MDRNCRLQVAVMAVVMLIAVSSAQAVVTQGDFEGANPLSVWSVSSSPAGQGNGLGTIDIDGGGPLGASMAFYAHPGGSGGGVIFLEQQVTLAAATTYAFSADLASVPILENADGGMVTVKLGGDVIASHAFGNISAFTNEYATLGGIFESTADGSYLLSVEFARVFLASDYSPQVFIDNIALEVIPAPGAVLLGSLGVFLVGVMRGRQQRKAAVL